MQSVPVPQIRNGKDPDAAYNASLGFWLPPDSPYGNLQLKQIQIVLRADEANRRIRSAYAHWANLFSPQPAPQAYAQHSLDLEATVHSMRRIADEFISLHYVLDARERDGKFPDAIPIDSIGRLLGSSSAISGPHKGHTDLLQLLNNLSNAHKHSFLNSGLNMVGGQEPTVYALGLPQNRLSTHGPTFISAGVGPLVRRFDDYYADTMNWQRSWSKRNLRASSAA